MNAEKCNEWDKQRRSPKPKNPLTNRVIKKGGPKYNDLDKECDELEESNSVCDEWDKQRYSPSPRNPYTNRVIKKDGPKYKELDQECYEPPPSYLGSATKGLKQPSLASEESSICDEWVELRRDPSPRNPYTRRIIKIGGPKYKELDKECNEAIHKVGLRPARKVHYDPSSPEIIPINYEPSAPLPSIPINHLPSAPPPSIPINHNINFYPITERQKIGVDIKEYFSSVIIKDGKACMSRSKTLLKYVTNPKKLGFGSFGTVYGVTIPKSNISVAIKEGRLEDEQYERALRKEYPKEYLYNKLINDLIDDKVCPNFSYTYAIFFCGKCSLDVGKGETEETQCSETIVELFDGILNKDNNNEKVLESILFQVFFAVASIQLKYGMFHNDVKKENILIKVIPSGGYWEYNLDGITYYVPNYGYIVALNDFGVSQSFMPGISDWDYGTRQAEVVLNSTTGDYYFRPFFTNYGNEFSIDDMDKQAFFHNGQREVPIPIDLKDFRRFPIHKFNYDIVDTVFMFIGGERTGQPGRHPGLIKSDNFKNLLIDFVKIPDGQLNFTRFELEEDWPLDKVYLFLANHAIKKIFSFYTVRESDGPKIETYNL